MHETREKRNRMKRNKLSTFWTQTMQPIPLEEVILLHLRLGHLTTKIWFGIVTNMAVGIQLGTTSIDRFIRGILLAEWIVVP